MIEYVANGRFGGKDQTEVDPSSGRQESASIARLAGGGFVVTYIDDRAVMVQRYDANGDRIGEAAALTPASPGLNMQPSVAGLASGGYAVSWTSTATKVVVQVFDAKGVAVTDVFEVGGATNYQQQPSVAGLEDGRFLVTWTFNGSPSTIRARLFEASGEPASKQFLVYAAEYANSYFPKAEALPGGGFVIAWTGDFDDEGGSTVRAQAYDAEGDPQGALVRIANEPSYFDNWYEGVAALSSGRYVLTWTAGAGDGQVIMAQVWETTGVSAGEPFQVNTDSTYGVGAPDVTALDNGGFLVTWRSAVPGGGSNYFQIGDVKGQAFDAQGNKVGEEFLVNQVTKSGQDLSAATAFGTGDVAVVWRSFDENGGSEVDLRTFYSVTNGNSAGNTLTGTGGVDVLRGLGGKDSLNGRSGADVLDGGTGDDTYYVDNARDVVIESPGNGFDRVFSSSSFSLAGQAIETLTLTGASGTTAIGNGLANALGGNSGNNVLDGRSGADRMTGGKGDDTYYVDHSLDRVVELDRGGADQIFSSVSVLRNIHFVEKITLTGSGGIDATGNDLDNILIGNSGNNVLNGGGGDDAMSGGKGNDRYYVNSRGDKVIEAAGGGTDSVWSWVSFSLQGQALENLKLLGSGLTNGTGNGLANKIVGNSAANVIDGGAGDDLLYGGFGNDRLLGGAGSDRFHFDAALSSTGNVDDVRDFSPAEDSFLLDRSTFTALAAGSLPGGAFRSGTAARDPSDRIIYDSASGNISYDPDGNGAAAAVVFAHVQPGTALTSSDFLVYGGG